LDRNMLNCTKCMQPIGKVEPVLALNRRWHPGCFVCEECNCNLVDKPFTSKLNAPYCETCFAAKHRPVCEVGPVPQTKCRKIIGRTSSLRLPRTPRYLCGSRANALGDGQLKRLHGITGRADAKCCVV
ncbi:Protein DA1-related 1, partial [Taenia solium]